MVLVLDRPRPCVASTIVGGGIGTVRTWLNLEVPLSYDRVDPVAHLKERADDLEGPPRPGVVRRGGERILVVEDEPAIRSLIESCLTTGGYAVTVAADGEAAARALDAEPEGFDLVISDVVMPRAGGRELHRRLQDRYPRVRALFISGYARPDEEDEEPWLRSVELLRKPFLPSYLTARVREILDR